ncbi:hypothetical protein D3C81_1016190 [compost metagenome]
MNRLILPTSSFFPRPSRKIHLAAYNRLDSVRLAQFIKRYRPVHHTVISERERFHPKLSRPKYEILQPGGSVQQAVFTMNM